MLICSLCCAGVTQLTLRPVCLSRPDVVVFLSSTVVIEITTVVISIATVVISNSSCLTRGQVFLLVKSNIFFNKVACLLVGKEDMSPCLAKGHVSLLDKKTCRLVQRVGLSSFLLNRRRICFQQENMSSCSARRHVFLF